MKTRTVTHPVKQWGNGLMVSKEMIKSEKWLTDLINTQKTILKETMTSKGRLIVGKIEVATKYDGNMMIIQFSCDAVYVGRKAIKKYDLDVYKDETCVSAIAFPKIMR